MSQKRRRKVRFVVAGDGPKQRSISSNDEMVNDTIDKRLDQISKLQTHLAAEKDARMEERFFFILVVIILFDIVFFTVIDSIGGPIAILILELILLIPLAKRMGLEEVMLIFRGVLDRVAGSLTRDPEDY